VVAESGLQLPRGNVEQFGHLAQFLWRKFRLIRKKNNYSAMIIGDARRYAYLAIERRSRPDLVFADGFGDFVEGQA
jgi:hypothetical protein